MNTFLLWLTLLVATPTVREVATFRAVVSQRLGRLEKLTSVEQQKDLRSALRNIQGNGRKQWMQLHKLDERIRRRMPVVVDPDCLHNPLC